MSDARLAGDAPGADQYLTFQLASGLYAIDIASVREIVQHGTMTPVPLMPAFVRGVINLRGAVVPVIDLQARLGGAPSAVGRRTCVVLYDARRDGEHVELGLMVDAVNEVIDLPPDTMEPAPAFGAPVDRSYVRAMARHQGRFVVVLEPATAFDIEAMARLCDEGREPVAA